jgi:tRNA-Thr(GGU) m(6)t(6)A37 methyltransferase TsaA
LDPWVPPAALEGLEQYSHCWVLYLFHANTDGLGALDMHNGPPQPGATFRAKVRVPRLDGKKMGVLATRSPHRPIPIGLSLAKIEAVKGKCLYISGADIVDGSPVVDIKPYLPFCEALRDATAPDWVQVKANIQ